MSDDPTVCALPFKPFGVKITNSAGDRFYLAGEHRPKNLTHLEINVLLLIHLASGRPVSLFGADLHFFLFAPSREAAEAELTERFAPFAELTA